MPYEVRRIVALAAVCLFGFVATAASAQTKSTSTETKQFQIISVDGKTLVVRGAEGTREITVPDDFKLTVNGKPMSVSELKPGMKGTATITTTTTTKPVVVTEVRNGTVVQRSGSHILVRTDQGFRNFTQSDVDQRGARIYRDGQPIDLAGLRTGDRLTATIVTEKPPQVMTSTQVDAILTPEEKAAVAAAAPAKAAPKAAAAPAPANGPAPAAPAPTSGTAPAPAKKLPKTGSSLPLVGLAGLVFCGIGLALTVRRRQNA
jgi:LPXTG-motif cell wall-anchored protein